MRSMLRKWDGLLRASLSAIPLLLVASPVYSGPYEWVPLEGEFSVTGEHLIDPSAHEPRNSHFRMVLRGKSAEALFLNMPAEPSEDLCTGAEARRVGDMVCLRFEGEAGYECDFSIRLKTQTVEFGRVC